MERFDLVVIGSGPAGEKGAAQAAYFGKRVALVEKEAELGGAGLNTGTVPSKTLRESALYYSGLRQRDLYGINYSLRPGLGVRDFLYRKDRVLETGRRIVEENLARHGIERIRGRASFEEPHVVRVEGEGFVRRLQAEVVLVATGSSPYRPPGIPFDDPRVLDSDTVLKMDRIPASLVVLGGGVIGCEYASIFNALDVRTTIVDPRDRLLSFLDREISERLALQWSLLRMEVLHEESLDVLEVPPDPAAPLGVVLKSGTRLEAEKVLFAVGRVGGTAALGLENLGLNPDRRGNLEVDRCYRTKVPHVYAAGDVIGFPALASVAMEQGRVAMVHAFGLRYKERVAPTFPTGIYTIPEIASIGDSEESAREKGMSVVVGRGHYERNARGIIIGDASGLVKLVFDYGSRRLVGAHCLGESATEIVHVAVAAIQLGATVEDFIDMVFNVPTLCDLYKYAAYDALGAWRSGEKDGSRAPEQDCSDL